MTDGKKWVIWLIRQEVGNILMWQEVGNMVIRQEVGNMAD